MFTIAYLFFINNGIGIYIITGKLYFNLNVGGNLLLIVFIHFIQLVNGDKEICHDLIKSYPRGKNSD